MLAGPADHDRVATAARTTGLVVLAVEQVGGAQATLDTAVEYARTRVQFGRAIGSFQAIKHRLADMLVGVELARSAAYEAAADTGSLSRELRAAVAASLCAEIYVHCAESSIQVHGGIGFTWEHSAQLHLKRARSGFELFGAPAAHRRAVATHLGWSTA
jgi:alkylation response protein AidB-like acyl-CoA dehydrogenase